MGVAAGVTTRQQRRRVWIGAVVLAVLTGWSSGCGEQGGRAETTLTVYAAASLAETFAGLAQQFETEHPGVEVRINAGGSADLAAQILEGAPADVFASADEATLDRVADRLAAPGRVFATNTLQIAVPPQNPGRIVDVEDLAAPDVLVVVCALAVPCGAAAARATAAAGVTLTPASEEQSVADVLAKVASGEADAGLVYRTDVLRADGAVTGIDLPDPEPSLNRYPIAPLAGERADLAREFVDFVLGPVGQAGLRADGFGAP